MSGRPRSAHCFNERLPNGRRRRASLLIAGIAVVAVASFLALGTGTGRTAPLASPGHPGPEGIPIPGGSQLAPTGDAAAIGPVDKILCQPSEQVLFHIHAHLTVFVDGRPRTVPPGIGIASPQAQATPDGPFVVAGSCFSWLHTHAADGIIHIESPVSRTFTLGNFFDVWGQPLSSTRVAGARGTVTAFVGGKRYAGNPRAIKLTRHAQIQLDVGRPVVKAVTIANWHGL